MLEKDYWTPTGVSNKGGDKPRPYGFRRSINMVTAFELCIR